MAGEKIFIGPKLRELRQSRKLTQAQMAGELEVSASYINLIERNQRPASLKFLINLSDRYGLNWRDLTSTDNNIAISDLRQITRDPAFGGIVPDIEELRSALEGSPNLMTGFINVFNAYRAFGERLAEQSEFIAPRHGSGIGIEQSVHDFFRSHNNYFNDLEKAAAKCRKSFIKDREEVYGALKKHLMHTLNVDVKLVRDEVLGSSLRYYDRDKRILMLSDGLDHQNRIFQLAHMVGMIEHITTINRLLPASMLENDVASSRCRVELANYFASAVLMPYDDFYDEALITRYDIERLAAIFSVSYEQVCHRLTTLQKPGKRGVPFFFLRIDRGGNVSKRFNVTPIQLARFGGACPKLDVHYCFRVPGRILTQVVEMPDHSRYMTINRTVERPSIRFSTEDKRLAISLGCPVEYAPELVYGSLQDSVSTQQVTEVGINCRLCPRLNCQQRAHDPFYTTLKIDEDRRGLTHFES